MIKDVNKMDPWERQDYVAKHYRLEWYYGTECNKCCGLYPKIMHNEAGTLYWFECENCGRRSKKYHSSRECVDDWNSMPIQLTLF